MALIALAESAQDIASGFNKFLDPLPEISTEITALISECYAISSALRELNNAKEEPRYYQEYEIIYNDVAVVRETLDYTFRDVTRFFGGLGRPTHISRRTAFHQVWREIDDFFYQESTASLCKRLEASRLFLTELICVLMDGRRPPGLFPVALEPPAAWRGGAGRYTGPMSPQSPPGQDHDYYPWVPAAPEVPTSPTTTTTFSTLSSSASSSLDHWLPRVFGQYRSATPFRQSGAVYVAATSPDWRSDSSRL
ncbi:MAG: hypothetical protein Q9205_003604 [Flavoplaca limonia]